MSDATRKSAQRFQFARAHLGSLDALEFGEIGIDFEDTRGSAGGIVMENPLAGDENGAAVTSAMTKLAFP
jgi:hypothetical protein